MTSSGSVERSSRGLGDRLGFGSLMIGLIAGAVALDGIVIPGLPSTVVIAFLAVLCAIETAAMLRSAGIDGFEKASVALAIAVVLARAVPRIEQAFSSTATSSVLLTFRTAEIGLAAFLIFAVLCVLRRRTQAAAQTLGAGALVLLVPTCLLYLVDVRFIDAAADAAGLRLLLFLVVIAKVGDIAAYFVGMQIGAHKLIPAVSPGKSWEGAVASLVASTGVGALLCLLPWARPFPMERGVAAAITINVASQFGDLVESLLKRGCGVKDSGRWIPQFGGAFDLADSLLLAAPVFYGFLRITA